MTERISMSGLRLAAGLAALATLIPPTLASAQASTAAATTTTTPTVRDSVGVMIVENGGPVWAAGEGWTIDPEPLLRLGGGDATDAGPLRVPRSIHLASDGRIYAVDGPTDEIRVFSPEGEYLQRIGQEGERADGFHWAPNYWVLPGDTALVYDQRSRRLFWFDERGERVREEAAPRHTATTPTPYARFGTQTGVDALGAVLGYARGGGSSQTQNPFSGEIEPLAYLAFLDFRTLEHTPIERIYTARRKGSLYPWTPLAHFTLVGDLPGLAATGSWHWQVDEFGRDGQLARIVRAPIPRIPGEVAADSLTRATHADGAARFRSLMPDSLPAAAFDVGINRGQNLLWDGEGHLWVRRATWDISIPTDDGAVILRSVPRTKDVYDILDRDRRWLGSVEIPAGIGAVTYVNADRLVTLWRPRPDRPAQVRVYRIVKG